MTRKLLCTFLCACLAVIFTAQPAFAKKPSDKGHILFVPHDNRPISDEQTADTIRKLGWEIDVPPDDLLGARNNDFMRLAFSACFVFSSYSFSLRVASSNWLLA
ncbi:MAG: DUF4127 family protein [Bacteroidaceae bacterium]|nr:DUF4127 family protein [Bacteroidaceae bacterium]